MSLLLDKFYRVTLTLHLLLEIEHKINRSYPLHVV